MIRTCRCGTEYITGPGAWGGCEQSDETYVGAVLDRYERNGSWDSDFYAIVWDEENQRVTTLEYATTRFWTYHNIAAIDATDEVREKALVWYRETYRSVTLAAAEWEATRPQIGSVVKSLTTSGKAKGVTGTVRWKGDKGYGPSLGLEVEGRDRWVFVAESRVELVSGPPVDVAAIEQRARTLPVPPNWRSATFALFGAF